MIGSRGTITLGVSFIVVVLVGWLWSGQLPPMKFFYLGLAVLCLSLVFDALDEIRTRITRIEEQLSDVLKKVNEKY